MNWGRETSPRLCTPRNERNFPRIRSLLHMAPTSQNDQPQRIERKLLAQTVRTDGQSLSHSLRVARLLNSYVPPRKEYCFILCKMVSSEKFNARVRSASNPLDRREEEVTRWTKRSVLFGGHT